MELKNVLPLKTRQELRNWFVQQSTVDTSCWIIVSMTEQPQTIYYLDAVEEALCFGWIDGIKKKVSDTQLAQRLSPRKKNSHWTELNKERVRRLQTLGLMKEEGLRILPDMNLSSFTIDEEIKKQIMSDENVYRHFNHFPELYNRIRIDTIQSYKKDRALFEKRLDKFITNTKENKQYGQWHDNGRLLNYE
ncbi:hypothetical protein JCM19047_2641 [Bacillus sp. JCM 19047]|nr:hypothetical protein JCM19047_2641 [Bacillus sp. JCM 19047]